MDDPAFPVATCLYLVYDPLDASCVVASAGHPAPLYGAVEGELSAAAIEIGPPLGVEYHAYETARFSLPEHGELALYTDGLTSVRPGGGESGAVALARALASARGSLDERCDQVLDALAPQRPTGDAVLLLAHTHPLPSGDVATWELDSDPKGVSTARRACSRQLAEWGLSDLSFTTELMVSELVTNAVRYGRPPIRLRPHPRPLPHLRDPRHRQLRPARPSRGRRRRGWPGPVHAEPAGSPLGCAFRPGGDDGEDGVGGAGDSGVGAAGAVANRLTVRRH